MARDKDRRDAVGNGPVKLELNFADEAADQRAVRAAPSPPASRRHLGASEADAHIGVRRMAGPSPNSRSSAVGRLPPRCWRSARRFSNDQPQIAQRYSASCICRKSAGGFFL
jgi:hypothetical protein